jgi:hypothetical protein
MPNQATVQTRPVPEPLYIADPKEGFLNWFADLIVERIITEVDQEQAAKQESKPE